MTEEFSIRFLAVDSCAFIEQHPAYGKTVLTVPTEHPEQGRVVAVRLNGVPLQFRVNELAQVVVNLIPLEGGRVELVCLKPKEPLKLPQDLPPTYPLPAHGYGLQPPVSPERRGSQWLRR